MKTIEEKRHYANIHVWIKTHFPKASYCSFDRSHKGKRYEWANITGVYTKNESDYIQLCPSCHRKLDFTEKQRQILSLVNKGNHNAKRIKVGMVNLLTKEIKSFTSIMQAERELGILHTAICNCLSRRTKSAGGYGWIRI